MHWSGHRVGRWSGDNCIKPRGENHRGHQGKFILVLTHKDVDIIGFRKAQSILFLSKNLFLNLQNRKTFIICKFVSNMNTPLGMAVGNSLEVVKS